MDPELLAMDDMPAEARQLIENTERQVGAMRDQARRQIDEIRARADRSVGEIEADVEDRVRQIQRDLLIGLKPMQDAAAKAGKLDAALAIRERVRELRGTVLSALQDPGNLTGYAERPPGTQILFDVTGSTDGIVWGSDVYTSDSTLAAAAVHAGVLRSGERGLVRVTMVDALNVSFVGSQRNGVQTQSYGPWPAAYRVARA